MCILTVLQCKRKICANVVDRRHVKCQNMHSPHHRVYPTVRNHPSQYCPDCEPQRQVGPKYDTDEDRALVYFKECGWSYAEIAPMLQLRSEASLIGRWKYLAKQVQSGNWNDVREQIKDPFHQSPTGGGGGAIRDERELRIMDQHRDTYLDKIEGKQIAIERDTRSDSPKVPPPDRGYRGRSPKKKGRATEETPSLSYRESERYPEEDPYERAVEESRRYQQAQILQEQAQSTGASGSGREPVDEAHMRRMRAEMGGYPPQPRSSRAPVRDARPVGQPQYTGPSRPGERQPSRGGQSHRSSSTPPEVREMRERAIMGKQFVDRKGGPRR